MHKINQAKILFNCNLCHKVLVEPITFQCGNTVCQSHVVNLLYLANSKFKCVICHENHAVPENGFKVNKVIQDALDFRMTTISKYEASANDLEQKFTKMIVDFKKSLVQKDNLFGFFDHPTEDAIIIDNIKVV
jgi:hypothetical protein